MRSLDHASAFEATIPNGNPECTCGYVKLFISDKEQHYCTTIKNDIMFTWAIRCDYSLRNLSLGVARTALTMEDHRGRQRLVRLQRAFLNPL